MNDGLEKKRNVLEAFQFIGRTCHPNFKKLAECVQNQKYYSKCKTNMDEFNDCLSNNFKIIFPKNNMDDSFKEDFKFYDNAVTEGKIQEEYQSCFKNFNLCSFCEQFGLFQDKNFQKKCVKRVYKAELCNLTSKKVEKEKIQKFEKCWKEQISTAPSFMNEQELDKLFQACK